MDIPPARSLTSPLKAGPLLHKAGGRAFPYLPHPWRRKHAVLAKGCLFLYDRPDAKGGDKGSGAFNLQFYDQVTEALTKETKKATHAFALQASDKTFADQGRYIFAADSAKEMHDWIRNLKKSIEHIRTNNRTNSDGVEETNPEEAAAETLITSDSTSKSKLEEETQTSDSTSKLTLEETSKLKLEETPKKNLATTVEEVVDKPKEKKSPGLLQNTDKKMSEDGFWILEESFDLLQNTDAKVPEEGKSVEKHSKNTDKKIVSKSNPTSAENSLTRKSSTDTKMKKEQAALISKSLRKMSKDSANSTENIDAANRSGESKKRKAVEDIEEELMSPNHLTTPTKLESMTKHRSRGPSGRRMPQNRRTIMMQHRTSSLTALAHGKEGAGQDNAINSFEPWLNRSLDLVGDDPANPSQPVYIWSDPEEGEECMYGYSMAYDPNLTYESNSMDGSFYGTDVYQEPTMVAPPLPPRMDSCTDYNQQTMMQANQFQLQQNHNYQLQQQQQMLNNYGQIQFPVMMNQSQCYSPYASPFASLNTRKDKKKAPRKQQAIRDDHSAELENELFIGDENSVDSLKAKDKTKTSLSAVGQKIARQQAKGIKRPSSHPEVARFEMTMKNLQKHVVNLDQAMNAITKEVEDIKETTGSVKTSLGNIRKDKDKLSDVINNLNQEVSKIKEHVNGTVKEAEKLQKAATASLVAADKAKTEHNNLKKEYETMMKDMKNSMTSFKKEMTTMLNSGNSKKSYHSSKGSSDILDESLSEDENNVCRSHSSSSSAQKPKKSSSGQLLSKKSKSEDSPKKSIFHRPSSLISGFTSKGKSNSHDRERNAEPSPKGKNRDADKKNNEQQKPMMIFSKSEIQKINGSCASNNENIVRSRLEKSMSSPSIRNRKDFIFMENDVPRPDSPEVPTENLLKFTNYDKNQRSPSPGSSHRPNSTCASSPHRQSSMSTVPEDRALDSSDRPSSPPPLPPTSRVFAISRQNSSPNIVTQKSVQSLQLPRQQSLGSVPEEAKSISRQNSAFFDDRPIVDQTLPLSPTQSMLSFPGPTSTASFHFIDNNAGEKNNENILPQFRPKEGLELIGGRIISGSSTQPRPMCSFTGNEQVKPLATSSLKRRKKVKT